MVIREAHPVELEPVPRPLARPDIADAPHVPRQRGGDDAGWRPLRIAMIGQKGMPATYGGIERHVEELASRLAGNGHEVTVYCRQSYGAVPVQEYRGVRLRELRTVPSKHLDAIVHSGRSTLAALRERADIVHYHGLGPGLMAPLPRFLSRARVVLTVHGLDNQRAKWGLAARTVLNTAHWLSGHVPDERVVVSRALARHYDERFGRAARYIPNGVAAPRRVPPRQLGARFGLTPGGYLLLVGRLVPEKAADLLIRAFRRVPTPLRLAVVGGSSFTDEYVARLRAAADGDPRIVFTGFAYGDLLAELYSHAAGFVQPSRLEGLPLTLLEAASYGLPVLVSDICPHVEVVGADGPGRRLFRDGSEDDLVRALRRFTADLAAERAGAIALRDRVSDEYTWDGAARDLERLYLSLARPVAA
ncbi:Glycosyltransferase involved in cell wall bisynthesis [Micromonospora pattaloongensis]|uniref:Glycosyltransferase involved in cell wall bisynthesis n=1 Tax=Micromonospora pattaloongensis TaxID=405436 RepID=A0A1H3RHB9_9ACTN|nr:glycosyltransferase family 4 protein [Micromonospora pattaloongensis]SDZ25030.1 Glycosyltransferase involved in cell wall bisynthesis [Micromonospora pattaloongensis]